MSSVKLAIAIFAAFGCGMLTHSKIYANYQTTEQEQKFAQLYEIASEPKETKLGHASWYSKESPGIRKTTANNEIFNDQALTAAMWDVPFNTKVRVTNLDNGKSVVVRINDRGPHRRFVSKGRIIDLSKAAFRQIGPLNDGLISVQLEML